MSTPTKRWQRKGTVIMAAVLFGIAAFASTTRTWLNVQLPATAVQTPDLADGTGGTLLRIADHGVTRRDNAHAGHQHSAVSAALAGSGHGVNGQVEDIGLHLSPQGTESAAAGGVNLLIGAELAEDIHQLAQAVGNTLHHGAGDIAAGGGEAHAVEAAAAVGIRIGAAFAGQIGGEDHAVRAGNRGFGLLAHDVIYIFTGFGGLLHCALAEGIAVPAVGAAGGQGAAEVGPQAGLVAAEHLQVAVGVLLVVVEAHGHVAAGADERQLTFVAFAHVVRPDQMGGIVTALAVID